MSELTVSVAMAAYNGEKYIAQQIESILPQLKESDELVISVNPSTDRTAEIVKEYQNCDSRVKISINNMPGVLANFENAIRQCKNDIIFLSDQDDIWVSNKVEEQLKLFSDFSVGGICHGCRYIDGMGKLMVNQPGPGADREITFWEIIIKNPVQGSTLAFRRELMKYFLPFPSDIPMHDSWIGLWICKKSKLTFIHAPLLLYRQHDGSVTVRKHKGLKDMILERERLLHRYYLLRKKSRGLKWSI